MRGRKPKAWSQGLSSSRAYGRSTARRDRAILASQLERQRDTDTQERARRVGALLNAIYTSKEDQAETGADSEEAGDSDRDDC
jgi:hypothetical protein